MEDHQMIEFHPHSRAFWEPVSAALSAWIFGGLFGIGLAAIVNGDRIAAALLWGGGCAVIVWIVDHFTWLGVVARSYQPQPAAQVEPEPEQETAPDLTRLMVQRNDKTGYWVIQPGCSIEQLSRFAQAIVHEQSSTTYQDIVVTRKIFAQQEYRAFVGWLLSQQFAQTDGPKGEIKLTDIGLYFVNSVFSRGIMYFSPAAA
jgi:hypothetical protein